MRRTWPALTRRTPSSGRSSRRSRRYTRTLCVVALVICLLLMFTACFRSCTPIFSVSTGSRTKALFGRTYLWQRLRLICCERKKLLHNWKVGFILVDKLKRSERESLALCSCTNLLIESHDQNFLMLVYILIMVIAFLGGIVSYFRWKRHWHNWIFFGILKFCPGSPVHAHFMCRCWNFLTNPSSYFRCYILLWVTHLRLYPEDCPKTVENFTTHCRNGYMTILYFTVWLKDSWFRLEILWGMALVGNQSGALNLKMNFTRGMFIFSHIRY